MESISTKFRSHLLNNSARDNIFASSKAGHVYRPWKMIRYGDPLVEGHQYPHFIRGVSQKVIWPAKTASVANAKLSTEEKDMKYSLEIAELSADVLLMPSPGEHFTLKVDCLDMWLNKIPADLSIDVRSVSLNKVHY